jgi:hypothetical protein
MEDFVALLDRLREGSFALSYLLFPRMNDAGCTIAYTGIKTPFKGETSVCARSDPFSSVLSGKP